MMAYFKNVRYQVEERPPIKLGDGENKALTPFEIKVSEASYSRNCSSRNYPALSVRPGMQHAFSQITTPLGLGQRNNQYPHVKDGDTWKRWDGSTWQTVQTGLTPALAKIFEFNTSAARYTILVGGSNLYAWDGTSVTGLGAAPETILYTVDDYRLYALTGTTLKCSAAGSITDWNAVNDAASITISSMIGSGSAITTYRDSVIAFSEKTMHILDGNDPYDFAFRDPIEAGCISNRSIVELDKVLYFLDYGKYKMYAGGMPKEISQKVRPYLEGINSSYKYLSAAGKSGKYIYLSIPYGDTTANNLTLEYDTEWSTWYPIDKGFVEFINIGEKFYGIDSTGWIWLLNSGTDFNGTAISWQHITGVWKNGTLSQREAISNLWMVVDLPIGSSMALSYSETVDGDDFKLLYNFVADSNIQNTRIMVPTTDLQNINWCRLKFAGTGPCSVYYVQPDIRVKKR